MDFSKALELLAPLLVAIINLVTLLLGQWEKRKEQLAAQRENELLQERTGDQALPSVGERAALERRVVARTKRVRHLNLVLVAAFVLLPVTMGVAGVAAWRYWSPQPLPAPPQPTPTQIAGATEIKITYPADGATVAQREMVRGTARGVPAQRVVWVVVYPHAVGRLYPQDSPVTVQANGGWASPTAFGVERDAGQKFDAVAVLVDEQAERAFRDYLRDASGKRDWPGLVSLPAGATIYDRVTVTRK